MMGFRSNFIILLCLLTLETSKPTNIRQIHILFRHGERSPSDLFSNDPKEILQWPDGLGHLTKAGKLQMYKLGQVIREKYSGTIPDYYYPQDVEVLSSYSDRCLMSAQLLTSGLFIPKNEQVWNHELLWQPIPISYKPRNQDNMIAAKQDCAKYDNLYKNLWSSDKYMKKFNETSDLFEYLTKHTGTIVDTFRKVEELYNTLEIKQLHNLSLPVWTEKVYPNPMRDIAIFTLASFTETDYMKRMKGGTFLKKVLNDMKRSATDGNSPKLYLYSGHDITIVNILRTLGLSDDLKPGFAAYLIFEFHMVPNHVEITYSDCGWCEQRKLLIRACDTKCTLDELESIWEEYLPKNWDEECKE